MKRSTAVRHVLEMAEECAGLNERLSVVDSPLRLTSFWAFGAVLEPPEEWPADLEHVHAAVVVTISEDRLPWYGRPPEARWLESMVRWDKRPVLPMWRPAEAPVWNHFIVRPMRLWDDNAETHDQAVVALRDGVAIEQHREEAPTAEESRERLERESAASLAAMARAAAGYDEQRWGRGKLRDYAEPLWEATAGYLDIREALRD